MEEKNVDITKYPEGLEYLAENLKLPLPPALENNAEVRKNYVFGLIGTLVRQ